MVSPRGWRTTASWLTAVVVAAVSWAHVLLVPYTKIEERFVLHAVHDALVAPAPGAWDYRQFPDPVPHSFAGVQALALASIPGALVAPTSAHVELAVRLTLASANAAGLLYFLRGLGPCGAWAALLTAAQFHFLFWAGRTTHNSLVLAPVLASLRLVFLSRPSSARPVAGIALLTFCGALLRSELVGLLAPATAWALLSCRISFCGALVTGVLAASAALVYGTRLDRPAWTGLHEPTLPLGLFLPEWEAVVFNILHGQSKAWGTMPLHWYATNALPRLLTFSLPLVPIGAALVARDAVRSVGPLHRAGATAPLVSYCARARACLATPLVGLALTATCHTLLLSLVAHKEWRFIVYTVPIWNALAARALHALWTNAPTAPPGKDKVQTTTVRRHCLMVLRRCFALGVLAALSAVTFVSVAASQRNYPGGEALRTLHQALTPAAGGPVERPHTASSAPVHVHVDVAATTTGATLFQYIYLERPPAPALAHAEQPTCAQRGAMGSCYLPRIRAFDFASSHVPHWSYSHAEDLPTVLCQNQTDPAESGTAVPSVARWSDFTHLVTGALDCRPFRPFELNDELEVHGVHDDVRGLGGEQREDGAGQAPAFVPLPEHPEPIPTFVRLRVERARRPGWHSVRQLRAWARTTPQRPSGSGLGLRQSLLDLGVPQLGIETQDALRLCARQA